MEPKVEKETFCGIEVIKVETLKVRKSKTPSSIVWTADGLPILHWEWCDDACGSRAQAVFWYDSVTKVSGEACSVCRKLIRAG